MSYRDNLKTQIRDAYGKLVYSYTCHWERIGELEKYNKWCNRLEIGLAAITATGVIGAMFSSYSCLPKMNAILATAALAVTLIIKAAHYDEQIFKHRKTADDLWLLREQYLSLLTDFEQLNVETIAAERDELIKGLSAIYRSALPTNNDDYSKAQNKLKEEEYQHFSEEEIDKMLPPDLRKE